MIYLLDTNVCIRLLNDAQSPVWERLRRMDSSCVAVCDIVKAELYFGVERSRLRERNAVTLEAFLASFSSFPFDVVAARSYGAIKADLTKRGELIGPNDLLIAAIALANGVTVVTRNVRELARVEKLLVENWEG